MNVNDHKTRTRYPFTMFNANNFSKPKKRPLKMRCLYIKPVDVPNKIKASGLNRHLSDPLHFLLQNRGKSREMLNHNLRKFMVFSQTISARYDIISRNNGSSFYH
jgi:hypothetical protein